MKRKIKKIIFEAISNTKIIYIIYIILFNDFSNDQDFAKLTGGTRQRGGDWITLNTVFKFEFGVIFHQQIN